MQKRAWAALPCCLILVALMLRFSASASTPSDFASYLSRLGHISDTAQPNRLGPAALLNEPGTPAMLAIGAALIGFACLRRRS